MAVAVGDRFAGPSSEPGGALRERACRDGVVQGESFLFPEQDLARLAVKDAANCLEGGEPDSFGSPILEDGDVCWGDPYSVCELTH